MAGRASPPDAVLRPGDESAGEFIIDQLIGKGSFACVYMGKHKVRLSQVPSQNNTGSSEAALL
jgi:hypothetical protein